MHCFPILFRRSSARTAPPVLRDHRNGCAAATNDPLAARGELGRPARFGLIRLAAGLGCRELRNAPHIENVAQGTRGVGSVHAGGDGGIAAEPPWQRHRESLLAGYELQ